MHRVCRSKRLSLSTWLALCAALPLHAATWHVEPGGPLTRLADAVRRAADGDTILVASGDYHGDVGVITQKRLTIRGVGVRPVFHADGQHAEGKAQWVLRDGELTVENLAFVGTRVPDGNGAGIRFERGHLLVRRCAFLDNQMGLLTNNVETARLEIEDSEFGNAPGVPGKLEHLLYVGRIASASVVGSHFHGGHTGHLIKSRAARTWLAYNMIVDGPGGSASYEVDLPNGGIATLLGNTIGQSEQTQNNTVVAYGAETRPWPENRLVMAHNTLLSPALPEARFLRVWPDRLPADTPVFALNNLTVGAGQFAPVTASQAGQFSGNHALAMRLGSDVALLAPSLSDSARFPAVTARLPDGTDLTPQAEFVWPVGSRALGPRQRWSAGAFQP